MAFEFLPFVSTIFGWVYTFCWSLSFYPQPLLNYSRRSTSGTTIDFPLLNCLGFLAYSISNLSFFYSSVIRAQYAERYNGSEPTVRFNDIAFAAHALLISLIVTSQYSRRIWGFTVPASSRPSRLTLGIATGCVAGVAVVMTMALASPGRDLPDGGGQGGWTWLDVIYAVSYVKLIVTVVKYTPQMVANYRNGSTKGWSIYQILLDFSGGLLSLGQLAIDSYLLGDWAGVTGNPVKFALGNVSILYDLIFMTQHYVLYRGADSKANEADPLLGNRTDEERRID